MKATIGDVVKIDAKTWGEVVQVSTSKIWKRTLYLVKIIGKKVVKWVAGINISDIQYALKAAATVKKNIIVYAINWTIGTLLKAVDGLTRVKAAYLKAIN